MQKIKLKWIWLKTLAGIKLKSEEVKLLSKECCQLALKEYQSSFHERKDLLRKFIHEDNVLGELEPILIIENGQYNVLLIDNTLVMIDFYIPNKNLFILLGDIRSSNWAEASMAGISRDQWEAYSEFLLSLATVVNNIGGRLLTLTWTEPLSFDYLKKKLDKILG